MLLPPSWPPRHGPWTRLVAALGAVTLTGLAHPRPALADGPAPKAGAAKGETAEQAQARAHFAHARELYQQGAYREAIGELEAAFALDPNGKDSKDLVFNLGVVHEKLGDIEDALKYFRRYEQMELTDAERTRADAYLKRLQGAKHEVERPAEPQPVVQQPPPPPPPPEHGRIDVFTIGAAGVAVVGFGVGTFFGLRALSERPSSDVATSQSQHDALQTQANKAHNAAIVADVAFATGIVATGVTAYLYFGRTRQSADGRKTGGSAAQVVLYGTALPQGGAVFLGARF